MRSIIHFLFLCFLANTAFAQYELLTVSPPTQKNCAANCVLTLITKQSAPPDASQAASWRVNALDPKTKEVLNIIVVPSTNGVIAQLQFNGSQISSKDPTSLNWKVAYVGASGISMVT